jgi:hypothetical protein
MGKSKKKEKSTMVISGKDLLLNREGKVYKPEFKTGFHEEEENKEKNKQKIKNELKDYCKEEY